MEANRTASENIDRLIFKWNDFPIDYWWRKRYNVPFGCLQHREMSFIDMAIEYREQIIFIKAIGNKDEIQPELDNDDNVVHMTEEEIDEEYENLDLSKF